MKKLLDKLYILDEIREKDQIKILHISDTPDNIYKFIFSVIDRLKPDYIIHTGDLVDNIKLGSGAPINPYKKSVNNFLKEFTKRDWAETYIVLGNHDDIETMNKLAKGKVHIYQEGTTIDIKGIKLGLAHYKENLPDNVEIKLYGHDKTGVDSSEILYLNGLLDINIILLPDKEVHKLSYPLKTDNGRQYKRLKLP